MLYINIHPVKYYKSTSTQNRVEKITNIKHLQNGCNGVNDSSRTVLPGEPHSSNVE